jgi:hypothetical protein
MDAINNEKLKIRRCLSTNLGDGLKKIKRCLKRLPRETTRLKSRKTVSFAPMAVSFVPPSENEIFEVLHIHDYSSSLIESIWYNEMDYQRIRASCNKTIRKMNSGKTTIERRMKKKYCPRGLEKCTDTGELARRNTRLKAREAVLNEQFKQWKNDAVDPVRIGNIYAHHCLDCNIDAIITGRRDELEAIHALRCKKKKRDAFIENSQKEKLEVHLTTTINTKLQRNTNAPPQA